MSESAPTAFLSYTHKDDEFFGGYITAFKEMLRNAVHVVSGSTAFEIFQDTEGIVIGDNWRRTLADVLHRSSFLLPMLTPLFFSSKVCREEITTFLEHERALGRDDLMLPIYFFTTAKLEKPEEMAKDPVATEIAKRQRVDWRQKWSTSLQESAARTWMVELAGQIASRIEALETTLGPAGGRSLGARDLSAAAEDPRIVDVRHAVVRPSFGPLKILWVDDAPDNNVWERRAFQSYGLDFALARSTDEAKRIVAEEGPFAAIISDVARPGARDGGLDLLKDLRIKDPSTPYFLYTGQVTSRLERKALGGGAQGVTADPDDLVNMVVGSLGKGPYGGGSAV